MVHAPSKPAIVVPLNYDTKKEERREILILYAVSLLQAFFSPILRFREQQNFRNLEFRREILEFSKKSFHFHGGNLEFPLSLEEKS